MSRACWATVVVVASAAALRGQVAWQPVNVTAGPQARGWHASALDPGFRVLVFGGYHVSDSTTAWLDDTWLFDGAAWTLAQPLSPPPARMGHGLAHDLVLLQAEIRVVGGELDELENPGAAQPDHQETRSEPKHEADDRRLAKPLKSLPNCP